MKKLTLCIFAFFCCFWLRVPAHAMSYIDDFADSAVSDFKSYTGIAPFPMEASYWAALPDRSAFSFAGGGTIGYAAYRVRGAGQVTVGLYTLSGSFVHQPAAGVWTLGIYGENTVPVSGTALASFSMSGGAVYAGIGGALYKAHASDTATFFEPTTDSPGDLVGYGTNVYASVTGESWTRVPLRQTHFYYRPGNPYVYEELTASIPSGTAYLRVELNDVRHMPVQGKPGSYMQKTSKSYNCLASVTITGDNLIFGTPEPARVEPVLPSESSSQSVSAESSASSRTKTRSGASAFAPESSAASGGNTTAGGVSPAPSEPGPSASKFEGVIESSSSGGRRAAASTSSSVPSAKPDVPVGEPSIPSQRDFEDDILYQIGTKNGNDNHFTASVTVYIIGVTGALAFIVLAAASKKR